MDTPERVATAENLRRWALDEGLKHRVMSSPPLRELAATIARRYTAGETIDDAMASARRSATRGHDASIEYVGESVRTAEVALAETDTIVRLAERLHELDVPTTLSLDLSHIGSVVDPAFGLANARRILDALAPIGATMMISAEGSDRTDTILSMYEALTETHTGIGITLQARLFRTREDLARVLALPGPIRLVKGAFLEPADVAIARDSCELQKVYLEYAGTVIDSGHRLSVATHDSDLIQQLLAEHPAPDTVEFEMLLGLGTDTLDGLRADGFRTREYSVFGTEWWLYVLNRIAEDPERVFGALVDLGCASV